MPRNAAPRIRGCQSIGMAAVRKSFSPEFVNRIDSVVTYKPLSRGACDVILDQILENFSDLIKSRLGLRSFKVQCTNSGRSLLLENGISTEFGARELKRTVQRNFIQPVAALVAEDQIPAGSTVILDAKGGDFTILLDTSPRAFPRDRLSDGRRPWNLDGQGHIHSRSCILDFDRTEPQIIQAKLNS